MSDPTVAAKEREVERNRDQLADTVDALHARLDVKARAQQRIRETRDRATDDNGRPRPVVIAGAAAALSGLVALAWWKTR